MARTARLKKEIPSKKEFLIIYVYMRCVYVEANLS